MKKMLVATVAGGLAFFVFGYLIYEVLLGSFYGANLESATDVVREVPVAWAMVVSQSGLAAVVTYVFRHAHVSTAGAGLQTGAVFGLLYGIAMAFNLYAVTNWSNVTVAFVEPVVTAVRNGTRGRGDRVDAWDGQRHVKALAPNGVQVGDGSVTVMSKAGPYLIHETF